jgi:polysaccharide chain length determinant protein (PEP-CTERM system associated)
VEQYLENIVDHLRGMWHRRFVGLAVAWVVAIAGVVVITQIPLRYEANARLQVDTLTLLKPVLKDLSIEPNLDQQVALISRTLLNRGNMRKLAREFNGEGAAGTSPVSDDLVDHLGRAVQISGNATSNVYSITYRDTDAQRAERVVSALVKILLDATVGSKREDSRSTLAFLDDQIARYEQNVQLAESRIKEFRLKHAGVASPGNGPGQDYFSRMSRLNDDIANAKLELRSAVETRAAYQRQLAAQPSPSRTTSDGTPAAGPPEIDTRLAAQKTKLDELLRTYTDQHPDVVGVRRMIAELEQQRQRELANAPPTAAASARAPVDPDRFLVAHQIRMSLTDAEAKVASAQSRLRSYEAQQAQLAQSGKMLPQIDAELAQLTQDYDVQKKTYTDLLARREALVMSSSAQDSVGEQIRIIDPPRVSPHPVGPSRMLMLLLVFAGAVAAGFVASFIANHAFPTFQNAAALAAATGRPLLGSLSLLPTEATTRRKRRGLLLFTSGTGALLASFVGLVMLVVTTGRIV